MKDMKSFTLQPVRTQMICLFLPVSVQNTADPFLTSTLDVLSAERKCVY